MLIGIGNKAPPVESARPWVSEGPRGLERSVTEVDGSHTAAGLLLSHIKAQGTVLPHLGPLGFGLYQGVSAGPAWQPME